MNLRGADRASRWPSLIAIVAVACLASALVGSWAVRSAATTSGSPPPVAAAQGVIDPGGDDVVDFSRIDRAEISPSAGHFDYEGPSSSKQRSYKTAGLKRDRPPSWSRSAPPEWWLPTPSSLTAPEYQPAVSHERAPALSLSGQELLSQICVARC